MSDQAPTCFVITGFGRKPDLATGRVLDLDKTYEKLIEPSCEQAGVRAFRAIDVNRTGSIDEVMYRWIWYADFVIGDLSTLNANALYELGVRHAQRPQTTILISENELLARLPFDLKSFVVHAYEHLGDDIADAEAERFVTHMADLLRSLVAEPVDHDSPIYAFLPGMNPPSWEDPQERPVAEAIDEEDSMAALIERAEAAKNSRDFASAIELFGEAVERNDKEPFLRQRLALVTYKEKEGAEDITEAIQALTAAEEILAPLGPDRSTDPETLGLSGAIQKRLHERTGNRVHLDRSIGYYERGFYVQQDYYNGVNAAFQYDHKASLLEDDEEALLHHGVATLIRERVAKICEDIIAAPDFAVRDDRNWIHQTLAQVYLGLERSEAEIDGQKAAAEAASEGAFDLDTFHAQQCKMSELNDVRARRRDAVARGRVSEAEASPSPADTMATPAGGATVQLASPSPSANGKRLIVDLGAETRPIASIELSCQVRYED